MRVTTIPGQERPGRAACFRMPASRMRRRHATSCSMFPAQMQPHRRRIRDNPVCSIEWTYRISWTLAHLTNDAQLFQILHANTFPSGLRHAWITPAFPVALTHSTLYQISNSATRWLLNNETHFIRFVRARHVNTIVYDQPPKVAPMPPKSATSPGASSSGFWARHHSRRRLFSLLLPLPFSFWPPPYPSALSRLPCGPLWFLCSKRLVFSPASLAGDGLSVISSLFSPAHQSSEAT